MAKQAQPASKIPTGCDLNVEVITTFVSEGTLESSGDTDLDFEPCVF